MVTHASNTGNDRITFAFYGAEPPSDAVEWFFRATVSWFTELGFPPSRLGVTGDGYSGKMGTFRRGISKVNARGFASIAALEVDALLPDDSSGMRYFVSSAVSRCRRVGRYAVISVPTTCCPMNIWLPIARQIARRLRPVYGIAYYRALKDGPLFYALGVNVCRPADKVPIGDEYERTRSISRWSDTGMENEVYQEGLLRYVYRWNFLTRPQLDREIEGVPLAEWIQADPHRGTLAQFADDVWLWEVENGELDWIRERLHDANAIFDWRRYCNVEPHIKTVLG